MYKERGQLPATVIFHMIVLLIQQIFGEPVAVCQVLCWATGLPGRNDVVLPLDSSVSTFQESHVLIQLEDNICSCSWALTLSHSLC